MPIYLLVPIILVSAIYIGVTGTRFAAKVEQEQAVRSDLVRSTLLRLIIVSTLLGFLMDSPFKSYGKYAVIMTILVVGPFLVTVERMKLKYKNKHENE